MGINTVAQTFSPHARGILVRVGGSYGEYCLRYTLEWNRSVKKLTGLLINSLESYRFNNLLFSVCTISKMILFYNLISFGKIASQKIKKIIASACEAPRVQTWFSRWFYTGLGYKVFVYKKKLYVWVGLSHYSLVPVRPSVKFVCKKRRFYVISTELAGFCSVMEALRRIKRADIYKAKGLLRFKQIKLHVKMKVGKKKQYV